VHAKKIVFLYERSQHVYENKCPVLQNELKTNWFLRCNDTAFCERKQLFCAFEGSFPQTAGVSGPCSIRDYSRPRMHAKKIVFLYERSQYVYENKGPVLLNELKTNWFLGLK